MVRNCEMAYYSEANKIHARPKNYTFPIISWYKTKDIENGFNEFLVSVGPGLARESAATEGEDFPGCQIEKCNELS